MCSTVSICGAMRLENFERTFSETNASSVCFPLIFMIQLSGVSGLSRDRGVDADVEADSRAA